MLGRDSCWYVGCASNGVCGWVAIWHGLPKALLTDVVLLQLSVGKVVYRLQFVQGWLTILYAAVANAKIDLVIHLILSWLDVNKGCHGLAAQACRHHAMGWRRVLHGIMCLYTYACRTQPPCFVRCSSLTKVCLLCL